MKNLFGLSGFMAAFVVVATSGIPFDSASAQTATNLKCKGCVGTKDIGKKAIVSKHIKNGKVKAKNLHNNAKPAASAFSADGGDNSGNLLSGPATSIRSATIKVPGPGAVIAHGVATMQAEADNSIVYCKISETVSAVSTTADLWQGAFFADNSGASPVSSLQVIPVTSAGNVTVHFVCSPSGGTIRYFSPTLSLLFVPGAQSTVIERAAAAEIRSDADGTSPLDSRE